MSKSLSAAIAAMLLPFNTSANAEQNVPMTLENNIILTDEFASSEHKDVATTYTKPVKRGGNRRPTWRGRTPPPAGSDRRGRQGEYITPDADESSLG